MTTATRVVPLPRSDFHFDRVLHDVMKASALPMQASVANAVMRRDRKLGLGRRYGTVIPYRYGHNHD